MQYSDITKTRERYPFLESSTQLEVISLLSETMNKCPDDTDFADACRLELLYRAKFQTPTGS